MKRLSKFNRAFSEPFLFCDGSYVLSAELYTFAADYVAAFRRYFEEDGLPWEFDYSRVRSDAVRFQFPPEHVARELSSGPCWMLGATGKGSKPVWVLPANARVK